MKEQQAVAEISAGNICRHIFYVSNTTDTVASPDEAENVPYFFRYPVADLYDAIEANEGREDGELVVMSPEGFKVRIPRGRYTKHILRFLDGKRTLREIFDGFRTETDGDVPDEELLADFKIIYERFNAFDWMLLRHRSIAPFKTPTELQGPVSASYAEQR